MYKNFLLLLLGVFTLSAAAQLPPKNWQLLDYKTDGVYGISVEKAYNTLLKGKKPKKKGDRCDY